VYVFIHTCFREYLLICQFSPPTVFHLSHLRWSHFVLSFNCSLLPPYSNCSLLTYWWNVFSGEMRNVFSKILGFSVRIWECKLTSRWTWASSVPRWPRRPMVSWPATGSLASRTKERTASSYVALWYCTSNVVFSFGPLATGSVLSCLNVSREEQCWWRD